MLHGEAKKQVVVSYSSEEACYGVMAHIACEIMWLEILMAVRLMVHNQAAATCIPRDPVIMRWIVTLF